MVAMKIAVNIDEVFLLTVNEIQQLKDKELMLRPVCFDLIELMTKRIHLDGKNSFDQPIGEYTPSYMKVRTGDFANATGKGKKKNAGTFTDRTIKLDKKTGVFTGEDKVGTARPKYNRTSETKVICSLTKQLENDWNVIPTQDGYGIGFLNEINFKKTQWLEQTYPNQFIFALSNSELDYAIKSVEETAIKILSQ
jgi:hypothetical protein